MADGINQLIAQGGAVPVQVGTSAMQGAQTAQQMRANMLANQKTQFENALATQSLIAKTAKEANTPEKWNQAIDMLSNSGIPGAEKYRDRFDQRNQILSMFGEKPEYTYMDVGVGDGKKARAAVSGTEVTILGRPFGVGGGTTVNVGGKGESKFWEQFSKGQADAVNKAQVDAQQSAGSLAMTQEARQMLNSGMITGSGANLITSAGKLLERIGIPIGKSNEETLANTQTYSATMGREVGNVIRLFGSGTGLSDADREYAQKIAGGEITLDATALNNLLDINERLNLATVDEYNKKAAKLEKSPNYKMPYSIQVEIPVISRDLPPVKKMREIRNRAADEGYQNLGKWVKDQGFEVYQNGEMVGYYGYQ